MSERGERLNFAGDRDQKRPQRREEAIAFPFRFQLLRYAILVTLVIFAVRFWSLQVLDNSYYSQAAENNRVREIPIRAPRGNILDRYGRPLVDSRPSMNIIVLREDITNEDETVKALTENFGVDHDSLINQLHDITIPKAQPIIIKRDANNADRAWIAAHEFEHPEVQLEPQPQRRYIYSELGAHALGYVGEITPDQLKMDKYKDYKRGDIIGQSGIEQSHNDLLRGIDGKRRVIVDRLNRVRGELDVIPAKPGHDIVTTIDLDLEQVAEQQLAGRRGVAIMMDPRNGEVLAMVSHPSFDPNIFSALALRINTKETRRQYQEILLDPDTPLLNRGTQGMYPTGSTWKILMTAAALEDGAITEKDSKLPCGGGIQLGNRFIHCDRFHGVPDIRTAITVSCDGYFYRLALKLGVDKINQYVTSFGMGQPTGIDLPEKKGTIPSRAWKARVNPRDPAWKDFDTAISGIGQGSVDVPPIQLLHGIDGIVMGGEFHTPHLIKEVRGDLMVNASYFQDKGWKLDKFTPGYLNIIRDGMWGAVNGPGGTAHAAHIDGIEICGKTGTAQVIADRKAGGKHKDHAWFVSYSPKNAPEISAVVLVENAGFGGTFAAPVTKSLYAEYYKKKLGHPVVPEPAKIVAQTVALNSTPKR